MGARRLVYDYSEGYVIDAETGEVVDRIFDYSPPRRTQEDRVELEHKKIKYTPGKKLRRLVEAYQRLIIYEEQGYIVDYERLVHDKMIKTLKHERSARAEKYFAEKGVLDKLMKTVIELDERGLTSGMTLRGRLVLAYILYKMSRGETPEYGELKKIVSDTTIRRIKQRLKKFLNIDECGNAETIKR